MHFQKGLRFGRVMGDVVPKVLLFGVVTLFAYIIASCSDNQTKPKTKKDKEVAASNDATNPDTPAEEVVGDGGDFVEDDEPAEGEITSIEELLKQCGGEGVSDAEPEEVIYE